MEPNRTNLRDTGEAAARLRLTDRTLEKWRAENRGPAYVKLGRKVFYADQALEEFVRANTVETS